MICAQLYPLRSSHLVFVGFVFLNLSECRLQRSEKLIMYSPRGQSNICEGERDRSQYDRRLRTNYYLWASGPMSGNDWQSDSTGDKAWEHILFFQRTQVQVSAPLLESSPLPVSPARGDTLFSSPQALHWTPTQSHCTGFKSRDWTRGTIHGGDGSVDRMLDMEAWGIEFSFPEPT